MIYQTIVTHPGGAHKDEFLACAVLIAHASSPTPVFRREPSATDLADPATAVIDVGGLHEPASNNFDHHQFPPDQQPPLCALSLVLMHLGLYDDAREFCDWLEPAEWFDVLGPNETARRLGIDRNSLAALVSPIDLTLLRRFASTSEIRPQEPLWHVMQWIGTDLINYLRETRRRLEFIAANARLWEHAGHHVLFLPRTNPLPAEPSAGLPRFIATRHPDAAIAAMIYPDRRGPGYALSRYNDHPAFDFTLISSAPDVHFAHTRGFIAKTSATLESRLRELLGAAANHLP